MPSHADTIDREYPYKNITHVRNLLFESPHYIEYYAFRFDFELLYKHQLRYDINISNVAYIRNQNTKYSKYCELQNVLRDLGFYKNLLLPLVAAIEFLSSLSSPAFSAASAAD